MLSEKPSSFITTSVAISDTGMAMIGMMRRAPALQEDEDDGDDEQQRLAERDHHVVHRGRHEARRVVVHGVGDALRESASTAPPSCP